MAELTALKKFMWDNHITQDEVADKLGIARETLNAKLNGKRDFKMTEVNLMMKNYDMDVSLFSPEEA